MEQARDLILAMWGFYKEISGYLLLGFTIAGLLYVVLPGDLVRKHLGKKRLSAVIKASILGVPLPLCSCGVLPTAFSLRKQGASKSATTSFLISTPQTGVDSVLVTYAFLGPVFAIFRPVAALLSGIMGGALVSKLNDKEEMVNKEPLENNKTSNLKLSVIEKIKKTISYAYFEFPYGIAKWMVIGIGLAGLIAYLVPDDFFGRYLSSDWLAMLMFLLVGIPFYTCSTGSVPIAAALLMKGLSPGAVFVFLVVGPVTSIASLTMILKILGKKTAVVYLATIVVSSLVFGGLLNAFYSAYSPAILKHHHHAAGDNLLPIIWSILLALVLTNVFFHQFIRKLKRGAGHDGAKEDAMQLKVEGMTCQHCVINVTEAIQSIHPDASPVIDLKSGLVEIDQENIDLEKTKQAIESKGYRVTSD